MKILIILSLIILHNVSNAQQIESYIDFLDEYILLDSNTINIDSNSLIKFEQTNDLDGFSFEYFNDSLKIFGQYEASLDTFRRYETNIIFGIDTFIVDLSVKKFLYPIKTGIWYYTNETNIITRKYQKGEEIHKTSNRIKHSELAPEQQSENTTPELAPEQQSENTTPGLPEFEADW